MSTHQGSMTFRKRPSSTLIEAGESQEGANHSRISLRRGGKTGRIGKKKNVRGRLACWFR